MKRHLLAKLIAWKDKPDRKPLILQGARQTGKTTLLHQFGEAYFPNVHSFNFEEDLRLAKIFAQNLDPSHIVNELRFYLGKDIDAAKDSLFLM